MLPGRIDRLPLPSLPLLDNVAQTGEGKVKAKDKGLIGRSFVHKPASAGQGFFRIQVGDEIPIGLRDMDGVERGVAEAQEILISRGNGHPDVPRGVPGS